MMGYQLAKQTLPASLGHPKQKSHMNSVCVHLCILSSTPFLFLLLLQAVGLVGAEFARLDGEMKKKQAFEELISDAQWGIQLGKRGVRTPVL